MPKSEITTEIDVAGDEKTDVKQLAIKLATMAAVTAASIAAAHFVIKKIEEKD